MKLDVILHLIYQFFRFIMTKCPAGDVIYFGTSNFVPVQSYNHGVIKNVIIQPILQFCRSFVEIFEEKAAINYNVRNTI